MSRPTAHVARMKPKAECGAGFARRPRIPLRSIRATVLVLTLLGLLAGCQSLPDMRGANFVQSRTVAWDSPGGAQSLARLRAAGANWVAFVPFLRQSGPAACDLEPTPFSSPESLAPAIAAARALGLKVALKPQVLIDGSWAGELAAADEAGWSCWFAAYGRALEPYARLARETGVDLFVAGTELKATESRGEWRALIAALRAIYPGPVSYVFHDPGDVARFTALDALERVGVSLYPPVGNDPGEVRRRVAEHRDALRATLAGVAKPLWIGEVGYPSRREAGDAPWQWNERVSGPRVYDGETQARVLDAWLENLAGDWNRGMLIWNWMSDPSAGGAGDTDFTPQNKPAERVLACRWRGETCAP